MNCETWQERTSVRMVQTNRMASKSMVSSTIDCIPGSEEPELLRAFWIRMEKLNIAVKKRKNLSDVNIVNEAFQLAI